MGSFGLFFKQFLCTFLTSPFGVSFTYMLLFLVVSLMSWRLCAFFFILFLFLHHIGYFKVCWFFFLLPRQIYHWAFSEFSTTFIELQNFYLVPFYNFSVFFSFYILYLVNHYVHTFIFSLNTDSFISLTIFIIVTSNFFKFCIWTPLEFLLMALLPYCSQCFHVSLSHILLFKLDILVHII